MKIKSFLIDIAILVLSIEMILKTLSVWYSIKLFYYINIDITMFLFWLNLFSMILLPGWCIYRILILKMGTRIINIFGIISGMFYLFYFLRAIIFEGAL